MLNTCSRNRLTSAVACVTVSLDLPSDGGMKSGNLEPSLGVFRLFLPEEHLPPQQAQVQPSPHSSDRWMIIQVTATQSFQLRAQCVRSLDGMAIRGVRRRAVVRIPSVPEVPSASRRELPRREKPH